MHQVILSKSITDELATKLDGVVSDWDGSEVNGRKYEALLDKVDAHARTSCRQAITLTAWECDACADELENSASALYDNGYKDTAARYRAKAGELYALAEL